MLDILDRISDMITVHDKDFAIVYANKPFAEYVGLPRAEILGEKCYRLIHGCNMPVTNCPHRQTLAGRNTSREEVHDQKSGKTFHVSTFPHFSAAGDFSGSVHIIRDVTGERERELHRIVQEVLVTLTPVLAPGDGSEHIRVHEAIGQVLDFFSNQGRLGRVTVERRYCPSEPVIQGSEGAMRQVLTACVANALDAMADNGALAVVTAVQGGAVLIDVVDTGPGIPPENIGRIFKPFFTTRDEKGGTGLGLSIARALAARQGGDVAVLSSQEGKGTTVRITFPV